MESGLPSFSILRDCERIPRTIMGRGLHVVKGRLVPDRAFFLHDEALAVVGKGGAEGVDEELHDGFTCLTKKVNNPVDYPRLMRKTSVRGVRLDVIGKAKFICSVSIYAPTVWAFSPLFIGTLIVSRYSVGAK